MIRLVGSLWPRSLLQAFLVLLIAITLDVISTTLALASGQAHEGNPLAAHFLFSSLTLLLLIKLLSLLFAFILIFLGARRASARAHHFLTLAFLAFALLFLVVSLSNLSAAYLGFDFFSFFLRRP